MVRKGQTKSFEQMFPSPKGRMAADKLVEEMDSTLPMTAFTDAWLAEYARVTGTTPWKNNNA